MLRNISDQPKSNLCPAKQRRYFVGQARLRLKIAPADKPAYA